MPNFEYQFRVDAPLNSVASFHEDTRVLKRLTPPPIFVKVHQFEPLAEGSTAQFTLWFGPFPVNWTAVHRDVSEQGFTDIQIEGPLASWRHTHSFEAVSDNQTLITEKILYTYKLGLSGYLSRLMYNRASLFFLFSARKWLTRKYINKIAAAQPELSS